MNAIRRPRRRPRVHSINWRVFGWVLLREVAVEVLCSTSMLGERRLYVRRLLCSEPRSDVVDLIGANLPRYEALRRGRL